MGISTRSALAIIGAILVIIGLFNPVMTLKLYDPEYDISVSEDIYFFDIAPNTSILLIFASLGIIGSAIGIVLKDQIEGVITASIVLILLLTGWAYYDAQKAVHEIEQEYSVYGSTDIGTGLIMVIIGVIIIATFYLFRD